MQKVTLLPPVIEDHNKSMEIYSKELVRQFKDLKLPIMPYLQVVHNNNDENVEIPNMYPVKIRTKLPQSLLFKYFAYPKKTDWIKDPLVHITDHSYGHLLYGLKDKKTIITCHDLTLLKFEKRLVKSEEDKDKIDLFKYSISALKKADMILADSKATQNDIEKYLAIPKNKIKVIPLGVNILFKQDKENKDALELKQKYQLQDTFVLLHVGNNAFYKNISFLLKTLYLLTKKQGQKVKLLKIGTDFTEFQKMMIRNLDLAKNIIHLGEVSEKRLIGAYNLADLLVYPSLNEGFGLPVVEAMACGTPVLVSDQGSLPGVVGSAGIILKPKDHEEWANKIKQFIAHRVLLTKLSESGLKHAKKYSWKETANKTFEVYQQVLNS